MTEKTAYAFDNAWVEARRRLGLLETVSDGWTTARMDALGVGPGWRCLEMGAGGGSMTRWLCERVGPDGSVAAVDLDTRFIAVDPPANLEIHERNILTEGLPGDGYDLVHTRFVLMHLAEREQVLKDLIGVLRPGGVILVEEADSYAMRAGSSPVMVEAFSQFLEASAKGHMDMTWARTLPGLLVGAGMTDVSVQGHDFWFNGGSATAELFELSFEQVRPLADEACRAAMDAAKPLFADPTVWHPSFNMIAASGRAPIPLRSSAGPDPGV